MLRETLSEALTKALKELSLSVSDIHLEFPEDLSHGDYTTNVALVAAKEAKRNPHDVAKDIVKKYGKAKV